MAIIDPNDHERMALIEQVELPFDLRHEDGDDMEAMIRKEVLQNKWLDLYWISLGARDLNHYSQIVSEGMKNNFFAVAGGGYYNFDNPESKKYVARINWLGMLTHDSDVFTHSPPEKAPKYLKTQNFGHIYNVTDMYASETQYGYVEGVMNKERVRSMRQLFRTGKFQLPKMTTIAWFTKDRSSIFFNDGEGTQERPFEDELVARVNRVHMKPSHPSIIAYIAGSWAPRVITSGYPWNSPMIYDLPPRLVRELDTYASVFIIDNDYDAQRKNSTRVFKTLIKLLKLI